MKTLETNRWLRAVLDAETSWSWLHDNRGDQKPSDPKPSDLKPLVALLRSDEPLSKEDRRLVADLLERHQLKKLPGWKGQREPIHTLSADDMMLERAREVYRQLKAADTKKEKTRDKLIEEVLATKGESDLTLWDCGVEKTALKNLLYGKRRSYELKKKRRSV